MIHITIEYRPEGFESGNKILLATAQIHGDKTGMELGGNYRYSLYGQVGRLMRSGTIEHFPGKPKRVWDLLYRILMDAVGDRNPKRKDTRRDKMP